MCVCVCVCACACVCVCLSALYHLSSGGLGFFSFSEVIKLPFADSPDDRMSIPGSCHRWAGSLIAYLDLRCFISSDKQGEPIKLIHNGG